MKGKTITNEDSDNKIKIKNSNIDITDTPDFKDHSKQIERAGRPSLRQQIRYESIKSNRWNQVWRSYRFDNLHEDIKIDLLNSRDPLRQ